MSAHLSEAELFPPTLENQRAEAAELGVGKGGIAAENLQSIATGLRHHRRVAEQISQIQRRRPALPRAH